MPKPKSPTAPKQKPKPNHKKKKKKRKCPRWYANKVAALMKGGAKLKNADQTSADGQSKEWQKLADELFKKKFKGDQCVQLPLPPLTCNLPRTPPMWTTSDF